VQAASFHKTSIDNLLHPRGLVGGNPYRIVLGEVRRQGPAGRNAAAVLPPYKSWLL
jgi:hypothetical protein